MYTATGNDFSTYNNMTHDNEEMKSIESHDLFSNKTMNPASPLLNSGE